jgi:hypothetical protein
VEPRTRSDPPLCRLGLHAERPAPEARVGCVRCGRVRVPWADAEEILGAPRRPVDLGWMEADGGSFIAGRCARARTSVVKRAAWLALAVSLAAWGLVGDPRLAGRIAGLALAWLGASILYVSLADALRHVVVRLDACGITVRRAPRFLPGERIDAARVEAFVAETEGARNVVDARGADALVARLEHLPLRTFAEAAYVAARLDDALARIRARAREADADGTPPADPAARAVDGG